MSKHIFRLRRGNKVIDSEGKVIKDEWAEYESKDNYIKPFAGELVLEYDNGIPRLKIGDGDTKFSELPYMSIDSFILPKQEFIRLSTQWDVTSDDRYFQEVKVDGVNITPKSKIDLQPTSEQLCIFHEKDLAFVAENEGGVVRVYCVGQVPQNTYDIPVTVTDVVTDDTKIVGNTTATPNPRSDWNQTDETKADYIKNKPTSLSQFENDSNFATKEDLEKIECFSGTAMYLHKIVVYEDDPSAPCLHVWSTQKEAFASLSELDHNETILRFGLGGNDIISGSILVSDLNTITIGSYNFNYFGGDTVTALDGVSEYENIISELQNTTADHEERIAEVETEIEDHETRITALESVPSGTQLHLHQVDIGGPTLRIVNNCPYNYKKASDLVQAINCVYYSGPIYDENDNEVGGGQWIRYTIGRESNNTIAITATVSGENGIKIIEKYLNGEGVISDFEYTAESFTDTVTAQ